MKKPNKVIQELKRIASENGGLLKPEVVVEEARSRKSPLHGKFTWDDSKAAHEHRLWQARVLINVSVELLVGTDTVSDVFVSLSQDRQRDGGGYRTMISVLSDAELRRQMLFDAMRELQVFQQKYSQLKELAEVFRSIRKTKRKLH